MRRFYVVVMTASSLLIACKSTEPVSELSGNSSQSSYYNKPRWGYKFFDTRGRFVEQPSELAKFDGKRPLFISFRGWSPRKIKKGATPTTRYTYCGAPDVNLSDYWIGLGWNFVEYDWAQLSDELEIRNAEAKIWSTTGRQGMRWQDTTESWHRGPEETVADIATKQLVALARDVQPSKVIFMGHSLGSQLMISVAQRIAKLAEDDPDLAALVPNYTVMTDPAFTNGPKSYLGGQWTGAKVRLLARDLRLNYRVPNVFYSCSIMAKTPLVLDRNQSLQTQSLYVERRFPNLKRYDFYQLHCRCKWDYFVSIQRGEGLKDTLGTALQTKEAIMQAIDDGVWLKESEYMSFERRQW